MVNKQVDLTIRDNVTGQYYRVPVLPEEISYAFGDAIKSTVQIIGLGNVDFHSGVDLDTFEWASFFPTRYDPGYCTTASFLQPLQYQTLFRGWKNNGTSLQLVCAAAGINANMTLNSFKPTYSGFEGDISYQVQFKERRVIKPRQVDLAATIASKPKAGPEQRNPIPTQAKPGTYTVKTGDCLTVIAKKLNISDWHTLYAKNKGAIGPNPGKIQPGTVLVT